MLAALHVPDAREGIASSTATFPDGGAYRIEIPSVEGPSALAVVLEEAARRDVVIHRVSQGSGVMMLDDEEIGEMVTACHRARVELCLFLGPRASWDTGAGRLARAGNSGARARGFAQLGAALEDASRAAGLGVRCLLVADEGVLWALHGLRELGQLPEDMKLKVSIMAAPANPLSFRLLQAIGADSINVPTDASTGQIAEFRAAAGAAIDFYAEAPDDIGGFVRLYEMPEVVRVGAPVYLKFGLRNAPDLYPMGGHLADAATRTARERVRRAHLALQLMRRFAPDLIMSPAGSFELAVPSRDPLLVPRPPDRAIQ